VEDPTGHDKQVRDDQVVEAGDPAPRGAAGDDRRTATVLAVGAAVCALLAAVLFVVSVRTGTGQEVEEAVIRGAVQLVARSDVSFTGRISAVNVVTVGLGAGVAVVVALVRRRPRLAAVVGVVALGSLVSVQLLKRVVLERPPLVPTDYAQGTNSFPSGHTSVGMVLAVMLLMVLPLRARPWTWVVVGLFGATFGVSTVLAAYHRPSDVVAAHLVVLAWALAGTAVLVAWRGSSDPSDPPPRSVRRPLAVLVGLGGVAAAAAVVMTVVVVLLDPARVSAMRGSFFVLAVMALSAEAAFVTGLLLVVFRTLSLDPTAERRGAGN
jgi:membrane-associated phospholipid phosphatase